MANVAETSCCLCGFIWTEDHIIINVKKVNMAVYHEVEALVLAEF